MIFSSLEYLLFLPIVVFLYWRTRGSLRLALVVAASYFFYMSWLPVYGVLLFALTVLNFWLGARLARAREQEQQATAKILLTAGLILNLGCLCYYKYTNFIVENAFQAMNWTRGLIAHAQPTLWDAPMLHVILPLGISFFVFEFVHYLVDVYAGNKPIKSFMEFSAFASFFPSQIAGPIKRYQDFQTKLLHPEAWTSTLFFEATALIVQGLFKKVAIADPIGVIVYPSFTTLHALSAADVIVASIGFVIQVYCDFSGYTDIGRGSALLLGIRLPENFNLPYLSVDLADFWRRWHMSLSYWLRDYVYIPLGGSRGNLVFNWRNLFLTMVACGLWHGASWHYVVFGSMQGLGMIANREWKNLLKRIPSLNRALDNWAGHAAGTALTMLFITVTYAVFRAPDMVHAANLFASLSNITAPCTLTYSIVKSGIFQFFSVYFAFWLGLEFMARHPEKLPWLKDADQDERLRFGAPLRFASWTAAVFLILAAKPTEAIPFVYFQF